MTTLSLLSLPRIEQPCRGTAAVTIQRSHESQFPDDPCGFVGGSAWLDLFQDMTAVDTRPSLRRRPPRNVVTACWAVDARPASDGRSSLLSRSVDHSLLPYRGPLTWCARDSRDIRKQAVSCSSTTCDTRTTSRDRHRMPITRRWSRAPKSPWKSRPRDTIRGQALRFPANQNLAVPVADKRCNSQRRIPVR